MPECYSAFFSFKTSQAFMRYFFAALALAFSVSTTVAQTTPRAQFTRDQLMDQFAGACRNPEQTFPTPIPADKKAGFEAWCACIRASIDRIPESRFQQLLDDTLREYEQYRTDPSGFTPKAEFSMIRISRACIKK